MKTNLDELSAHYMASLRERTPADHKACPPVETILACALVEMPQDEKDEIIAHVAGCTACAAVLKQAFEIAAETDRFAAEVQSVSRAKSRRAERDLSLWARLARRPALAVAAGLFALTVMTLSVIRFVDRSATRGGSSAAIVLVSPVKAVPAATDLVFKWRPMPDAGPVVVKILDEALQPVWQSDAVTGTEWRPTSEARQRLTPGRSYFWLVTTAAPGRPEIKSRLAEFSVGK